MTWRWATVHTKHRGQFDRRRIRWLSVFFACYPCMWIIHKLESPWNYQTVRQCSGFRWHSRAAGKQHQESKLCPRQESTAFAWVVNFSTSCPARLLASLWQLPTSVPSQDGAYAAYLHRKHGSSNFAKVRAEDFSILDWQTYRCFLCPSRDRSCWQLSVEPPEAHWSCPSPIKHLWRYSAFLEACMILCFGLWTDFPVSQHLQYPEQRLSNSSGPHLAMQIYIQMNDLTMSHGSHKA